TKEIGIRKVLGASIPKICLLLSREFFKWIMVANLIAWPAAYFVTGQWLRSFAHRADLSPWIFILSGVLSVTVAAAAIGYQSIRAAFSNPIKSLRYE
ncbi:MAG: ABC transporter permease, partial [Candidatus Aminicenantaceae bacterium]